MLTRADKIEWADLWGVDDQRHPAKPCFAFLVFDDIVIQSAPIARWMEGRTLESVLTYWRKRGAKVEKIKRKT